MTTQSNDGDVSGNHGGRDIWIARLDSNLNIIWQRCYGGSAEEDLQGLFDAGNNQYVIAGITQSNNGDVNLFKGQADIWMLKIDSTGNIINQRAIGGSMGDWIEVIGMNTDYSFSIVAGTNSHDGDAPYYTDYNGLWSFDIDSGFNTITNNFIRGLDDFFYYGETAMLIDSNRKFICEEVEFDVLDLFYTSSLSEFDQQNNFIKIKSIYGDDIHISKIIKNVQGGYFTAGVHYWTEGDFPYGNYSFNSNAFIQRFDDSLNNSWYKDFGGSSLEQFFINAVTFCYR